MSSSQCSCFDSGLTWNPYSSTCGGAYVSSPLPGSMLGSERLFIEANYDECPDAFADHIATGYHPESSTSMCSCILSGVITLDTVDTDYGFQWNGTACHYDQFSNFGGHTNQYAYYIACAEELLFGYPQAYSGCGTRNMCACMNMFDATFYRNYIHNLDGGMLDGVSMGDSVTRNLNPDTPTNQGCGWDPDMQLCVPMARRAQFDRSQFKSAKELCYTTLKYAYDESPTYTVTQLYVDVDECNVHNNDVCACNRETTCLYDSQTDVCSTVDARSESEVTASLVSVKCGTEYCSTLGTVCDCYETPYISGTCGWNGTTCVPDFSEDITFAYQAHCCDSFKTPCECKIGRLPHGGLANYTNTCGWDGTIDKCRVGAITTDEEITLSGCNSGDQCLFIDDQLTCDTTATCSYLPDIVTCVNESIV